MVEIEVANRSGKDLDVGAASDLIREVLHTEGIGDGELGLQLVGPQEIRDLKRAHLGIDEETDALAFPIDGIAFVRFGHEDVVRHKLVQRIVEAYKLHAEETGTARRK